MAAILRSGKFLRIVSGLTRQRTEISSDEKGKSGPQSTTNSPLITSSYSGSVQQFHSLSLQQLYNTLPVLNPEQELDKKKNEDRELFTNHHVNHNGFEHDSLDEISSLSGLTTSSLNSSVPAEDYTNRQVRIA